LLPSGTLLCRDAPIARIGTQRYHVSELPAAADSVMADEDGMIEVDRPATEVFRPEAMASFEGAPVTLGHPDEMVGPDNHRSFAVGHVQNVRRDGALVVADLLISDRGAIDLIRNRGWRGVSAGYDARYQPTGDGGLRQTDVVANHIALLPPDQEPRCGDQCFIGDAAPRPRACPGLMRTRDQWAGSGADTPPADPRDPLGTGIVGAQESGGPPGIAMHRRGMAAIAAADAARCRTALRSINETNRAYWEKR
jgi:hypothetical protein